MKRNILRINVLGFGTLYETTSITVINH